MKRSAALLIFFASGFAALLYQTVWQRLLTLFGGADVFSITIVVAAFMAGLGAGSLVGGVVADRLPARRRVIAFALCEFSVAAFAAFSGQIYYDWLYLQVGELALSHAAIAALIFAVTLLPTFLMGMSLPIATKMITTDPRQPARWVPILYGVNTLGAAAGSGVTVLWLFPTFDLRAILWIGAAISAGCGLGALLFRDRSAVSAEDAPLPSSDVVAGAEGARWPLSAWMALYALAGFIALSLEIVWFRVLGVALKSNSRTFGIMLAIFLTGVGAGAVTAWAPRVRRLHPVRAFFLLQAAIPAVAVLLLTGLVLGVESLGIARPLWEFFASTNPPSEKAFASGRVLALYATVPVVLMLPSTLLMGLSFGLLHRAVQTDTAWLGRRVGSLQAANIAGSAAGALVTGLWVLDRFGSTGALSMLVVAAASFLVADAVFSRRLMSTAAWAALPIAAVITLPTSNAFWSRLHGTTEAWTITREDATGLILLRDDAQRTTTQLFVSGFSQSWFPYGSIHTLLGVLPALVHDAPRTVGVIGLGSGDTVFAIGARADTQTIEVIEIIRAQHPALEALDATGRYAGLHTLLTDPRVQFRFTDARAFLRARRGGYDIIEADAIPPWGAYAGNLYSTEFFALLRRSLRPGGIAVTWTPTERTRASFLAEFPYVLMFKSVAVGSEAPIPFTPALVNQRMHGEFTRRRFLDAKIDLDSVLREVLTTAPVAYGPDFDRRTLVDVNRDLFPQDEFVRPYSPSAPSLGPVRR